MLNLREMRRLLDRQDIRLTKSLGQNFLHDAGLLRKIADAAELTQEDQVLEVGPGLGPLTELLLERAGKVLAMEMDQRLVAVLRERFPEHSGLELLEGDALVHLKRQPRDWSKCKLVSNLPYSVGSPILAELGSPERETGPMSMVVTLQEEVVQRIIAKPGTKAYGVLTLLLAPRYEATRLFGLPPEAFFPPPDIDSACLRLSRRAEPVIPTALARTYLMIVRLGFSQRRKKFGKLLKAGFPQECIVEAFEKLGLEENIRAEALPLETFRDLALALDPHHPEKRKEAQA